MPKLKASYDQQSDIPQALQDLYIESGGKWVLDAEGVEDVAGLRSALSRLKQERTELKKFADRFKEVDLEAFETWRESQTSEDDAEESGTRKKPVKKGKGTDEEAFARRLKEATQAREAENQRLREELARERITSALKSAALQGGIRDDAIESMVEVWSGKTWRLDDKGQPRAYNGDDPIYGRNGEPLSMPEFVDQEIKAKPFLLKPSNGQGATHQGRNGQGAVITLTRAQARDITQYEAAKKRAQETGGTIQVTD